MAATKTRTEHDLIGNFEVPADAYYGVQTARALENFQISGVPISLYPNFIKALAMVKTLEMDWIETSDAMSPAV